MAFDKQQFSAAGQILVARFVMIDKAANNKLEQADGVTANGSVVGCSSEGAQDVPAPGLALALQVAAEDGDHFEWYSFGESARVYADGVITAGTLVMSTSVGKAKTLAGSGKRACGIAIETCADTELCLIWLLPPSTNDI